MLRHTYEYVGIDKIICASCETKGRAKENFVFSNHGSRNPIFCFLKQARALKSLRYDRCELKKKYKKTESSFVTLCILQIDRFM